METCKGILWLALATILLGMALLALIFAGETVSAAFSATAFAPSMVIKLLSSVFVLVAGLDGGARAFQKGITLIHHEYAPPKHLWH